MNVKGVIHHSRINNFPIFYGIEFNFGIQALSTVSETQPTFIKIAKMEELRQKIVEKLQGKSEKVDEALLKAKQGNPITSRLNQCGKKLPQTLIQ